MEISVENLQKKVALNHRQILKIARAILRHEGVKKAVLTIVFVTSQRIKALNKEFLGRNYATDVLAFDANDFRPAPRGIKQETHALAGDIIISIDAAIQNSIAYKTELPEEITLYVIHGILHLLGFDDHRFNDRNRMRKKEQELLSYLGKKVKGVLA